MTGILVFALIRDGEIEENVLGVLSKVKNFSALGEVSAALLCEQVKEEWISTLGKYGAKKVYVVEAPELKTYLSRPYVKAMLKIIKKAEPSLIIGGGLVNVEDLIPRLAVHHNTTCLERVTNLVMEGNELIAITPVRDDQAMVKMKVKGEKTFITTRAGAMFTDENPQGTEPEVEKIEVTFDESDMVVKSVEIQKAKKTVNLKDAKIIVAGGRGVGGKEKFAIIQELADLLGGEMGATRACTDLHWVDETYEIGQTGQSVSPDLYIAAGISGAPQHICGVKAKTLIAINTDDRASIFKYCDYGIVGDLHQILPILKEKIK